MRNPLARPKPEASGYAPVPEAEADPDRGAISAAPPAKRQPYARQTRDHLAFLAGFVSSLVLCAIALLVVLLTAETSLAGLFRGASGRPPSLSSSPLAGSDGNGDCPCAPTPTTPTKVPQYFQTEPELWAGPTRTGKAPFLAQTRTWPVADATGTGTGTLPPPTAGATYVPNEPLQTAIPVEGMREGDPPIFALMGYLAPYRPSDGFGVGEWPLPEGAEIVQVQVRIWSLWAF